MSNLKPSTELLTEFHVQMTEAPLLKRTDPGTGAETSDYCWPIFGDFADSPDLAPEGLPEGWDADDASHNSKKKVKYGAAEATRNPLTGKRHIEILCVPTDDFRWEAGDIEEFPMVVYGYVITNTDRSKIIARLKYAPEERITLMSTIDVFGAPLLAIPISNDAFNG